MITRALIALAMIGLPGAALAQSAPFCAVGSTGERYCFYYSLQTCQYAAKSVGGVCDSNSEYGKGSLLTPQSTVHQVQPMQQCKGFNFGGGVCGNPLDAYNEIKQIRRDEEEHQARMELLRAQTAAAQAPAKILALPVFLCRSPERLYYSDVNQGGCVFLGELPMPSALPSPHP